MRTRWWSLSAAALWLLAIVVAALSSDLDCWLIALVALLGLMTLASTVVSLTALRALARVEARLARPLPVARKAAAKPKAPAGTLTDKDLARVRRVVGADIQRTFRQSEALTNLYAMLPIQHALPASRGFPASPDVLLFLVDLVDRQRSRVIVECGSGLSTLCFALALRQFGIDGRVIALEHLEPYAEQTRELLRRHGVDDIAEVRTAPLEEVTFGDEVTSWYARSAWEDLADVDLLFVDGPPATLGPLARYPVIPFLLDTLTPDAQIVLDDYNRAKEQAILQRWQAEHPGLFEVTSIPLEKGAALVTLNGA
ncbi:MAG: class I SAM-dependent methyltransferase [Propionibacteriales bacterium]|nr:class I SAM-dependent methyltransferase [Propionibacteriales bacterium]